MSRISIALATRNGEKFLPAQLQSLVAQNTLPAELVVTDDCSEDRTVAIVRAFAERAPFPVQLVINDSTLGYRRNFMRAAELCTGDLIAFCDQDDVWEANKLTAMTRVFEDNDVLLAFHNATLIDDGDEVRGRLYRGQRGIRIFEPLMRSPWLVAPGFTQVFRRDLMRWSDLHGATFDVDWPQEPLAHDQWFALLASVLGKIAFVRRPLARYRQHGDNTFGVYPDRRARLYRLARGGKFIRLAAQAASSRSELLERMQMRLPAEQRELAQRGIAYYSELRQRLERRLDIYTSRSLSERARAMIALTRSGGYRRGHGSARFTNWDFLMDLYLAVPLGPRLQYLLPW